MGEIAKNPTAVAIGKKLKQLRESKGLDTKQVAEMIGVGQSAYNHYENGVRKPTVDNILSLAKFYGVSTDYILGASDMGSNEVSKETISNIDAKAEELLQNFIQMPDSLKVGIMQWLKSTLDTLDIEPVQLTESQEKLIEKYEKVQSPIVMTTPQTPTPTSQEVKKPETFEVKEVARHGQIQKRTLTQADLDFLKANQLEDDYPV